MTKRFERVTEENAAIGCRIKGQYYFIEAEVHGTTI